MSHRCRPRVGSDGFCFAGGFSGTGRKDKPARCQKGVPPGTGTSELPLSFSMQSQTTEDRLYGQGHSAVAAGRAHSRHHRPVASVPL